MSGDSSEPIGFTAEVTVVADTALVRLPTEASERLPSRGQVAVDAVIGDHDHPGLVG